MTLVNLIKKTGITLGLLLTLNQTCYAELETNPIENNQNNQQYHFESIDAKEALVGLEKVFLGLYDIEKSNQNIEIIPKINYFELNPNQISDYKFPNKLLEIVDSSISTQTDYIITLEEIGETYRKYEENITKNISKF